METISGIINIMGNGFFPIVVCGFLFWYVWKKDAQHKLEIDEMRKTIQENTLAVLKLVDAVDDYTRREGGKNGKEK